MAYLLCEDDTGGWSDSAEVHLAKTTQQLQGNNWQAIGGELLNLAQIDDDLTAWSA